jgi:hypothetical protein
VCRAGGIRASTRKSARSGDELHRPSDEGIRFRSAGRDEDEAIAGVVGRASRRFREESAAETSQGWSA